jgi:hypothetical protein
MSQSFNEALKKINALLASNYNDDQLERLKNDIRGMALYGEISDAECYTLLEKLPNLSSGIDITDEDLEKYKAEEEKKKEENTQRGFNTDEDIVYKLYHTAEDDVEVEKDTGPTGFNTSNETKELYDKYTSDEDDYVPPEEKEDNSSFFSTECDDYSDDDEEDEESQEDEYEDSSSSISSEDYDYNYDEDDDDEDYHSSSNQDTPQSGMFTTDDYDYDDDEDDDYDGSAYHYEGSDDNSGLDASYYEDDEDEDDE